MAAATGPITITSPSQGDSVPLKYLDLPVKANTIIYAGTLVVVDAGYAAPARTATGLLAAGRAGETVDNTGGAAGAKRVRVDRGAFPANNSASGDAIAQADLLKTVYFVDDNTYAKTDGTGTRSAAGKFVGFNDAGRPVVEMY
jgi:hypothetical protein